MNWNVKFNMLFVFWSFKINGWLIKKEMNFYIELLI